MPRSLLVALVALALPLLSDAQTISGRRDSVFTWQGALRPHAVLHVRNFNGPIDLRASTGSKVELRAVKRHARNDAVLDEVGFDIRSADNGDLSICSTWRDRDPCDESRRDRWDGGNERRNEISVAMTVLVPRGAAVRVVTGNGAISVEELGGAIDATTGNGQVQVNGTDGVVRVRTGNGDVEVRDARASVHVATGNGRVDVTTSAGPVDARSGNGDIDVRISGGEARAPMSFSTGSGNVRIALPAAFNGELDASTGNGTVRSAFEATPDEGSRNHHRVRVTIGSGGPLVRASTGNGNVEIRKL